jgi:hypothetical protein
VKTKLIIVLATIFFFSALESLFAQDLGPQFKKVSEGIYVYAAVLNEANSTIVLTQDGVVLIRYRAKSEGFARCHGCREEAHSGAGANRHSY